MRSQVAEIVRALMTERTFHITYRGFHVITVQSKSDGEGQSPAVKNSQLRCRVSILDTFDVDAPRHERILSPSDNTSREGRFDGKICRGQRPLYKQARRYGLKYRKPSFRMSRGQRRRQRRRA